MSEGKNLVVAAGVFLAIMLAAPVHSDSVSDFYEGRQVRLLIGYSAGGGYDTYAELGFVGTPKEINKDLLLNIIKEKIVPIIMPMGTGDDGNIYNINADVAAGSVAKSLNSRRLLLMTDVEGLLDKNKKLILEINSEVAKKMLEEKTISGGMIPKINTCIDAVENGVTGVVIVDGRKPHSILFELFSDKGSGTLIRK